MKKLIYILVFAVCLGFTACSDDDEVQLPAITVNFGTSQLSIGSTEESKAVSVSLSRAAETDISLSVSYIPTNLTYGEHFITTPTPVGGIISLTVPAGNTSASFTLLKEEGVALLGDEKIDFTLALAAEIDNVRMGERDETTLVFGSILSGGDQITLEGKTAESNYANSVYLDFSDNAATVVSRKSWALGFYCGADRFTVVLNGAYATAATASTKTDINSIELADAESAEDIGATPMSQIGLSIDAVDSGDGSLTGTVFGEVSATGNDNYVFFVATEDDKANKGSWYKVKVDRNVAGDGYTVKYGKVDNSISVETIEIPKDPAYNFKFLSLSTGNIVDVEPQAAKWDIFWGYNIGFTAVGMEGEPVAYRPYFMQDLIMINNVGGAQAAQVMVADVTYLDYSLSDIAASDFSSERNIIGSNWRATTGANMGVFGDRFYVVKDPEGNYYKMRVLRAGINGVGDRGRPIVEYALLD